MIGGNVSLDWSCFTFRTENIFTFMTMPLKSSFFLLGFFFSLSLSGQSNAPAEYDSEEPYAIGALVVVGDQSYIATAASTGKNPPDNSTGDDSVWTNLSVAASALDVPVETVPDLSTATILASLPGSDPPDSDSNATGTPRIVRISVRGHIGTGDDERFVAFKISGTGSVMVRAIGPALGKLAASLATVSLLDPEMTMYSGNTAISANSNDNYTSRSEASQITSLSSSLYPSIPIQTSESASIAEYSTGTYSSNVRDKSYSSSYGSRIGWVGIDMTETNSSAKFLSVATRGIVKPGDGAMFAAFEIIGDSGSTRKIFLRGRGASLASFGVSNVLSDIMLNLYKFDTSNGTATLIVGSKDYTTESNSAEIASKAQSLLGQALNEKDPGLIMDLAPGYYSINIESESGATGNAWLGIDDITE